MNVPLKEQKKFHLSAQGDRWAMDKVTKGMSDLEVEELGDLLSDRSADVATNEARGFFFSRFSDGIYLVLYPTSTYHGIPRKEPPTFRVVSYNRPIDRALLEEVPCAPQSALAKGLRAVVEQYYEEPADLIRDRNEPER